MDILFFLGKALQAQERKIASMLPVQGLLLAAAEISLSRTAQGEEVVLLQ
jgi:hypothetical protein